MGEYFVLMRVIANPVAAEILEAEPVLFPRIAEYLGGIVARHVGEDVPNDPHRKSVDAGDEGGGHCLLLLLPLLLLLLLFSYVYQEGVF